MIISWRTFDSVQRQRGAILFHYYRRFFSISFFFYCAHWFTFVCVLIYLTKCFIPFSGTNAPDVCSLTIISLPSFLSIAFQLFSFGVPSSSSPLPPFLFCIFFFRRVGGGVVGVREGEHSSSRTRRNKMNYRAKQNFEILVRVRVKKETERRRDRGALHRWIPGLNATHFHPFPIDFHPVWPTKQIFRFHRPWIPGNWPLQASHNKFLITLNELIGRFSQFGPQFTHLRG